MYSKEGPQPYRYNIYVHLLIKVMSTYIHIYECIILYNLYIYIIPDRLHRHIMFQCQNPFRNAATTVQ